MPDDVASVEEDSVEETTDDEVAKMNIMTPIMSLIHPH